MESRQKPDLGRQDSWLTRWHHLTFLLQQPGPEQPPASWKTGRSRNTAPSFTVLTFEILCLMFVFVLKGFIINNNNNNKIIIVIIIIIITTTTMVTGWKEGG